MKAKKDEMMQKYGRLDWGPVKNDNKRNAEEGKRYEGCTGESDRPVGSGT